MVQHLQLFISPQGRSLLYNCVTMNPLRKKLRYRLRVDRRRTRTLIVLPTEDIEHVHRLPSHTARNDQCILHVPYNACATRPNAVALHCRAMRALPYRTIGAQGRGGKGARTCVRKSRTTVISMAPTLFSCWRQARPVERQGRSVPHLPDLRDHGVAGELNRLWEKDRGVD